MTKSKSPKTFLNDETKIPKNTTKYKHVYTKYHIWRTGSSSSSSSSSSSISSRSSSSSSSRCCCYCCCSSYFTETTEPV